jgi:putative flippase GtrA
MPEIKAPGGNIYNLLKKRSYNFYVQFFRYTIAGGIAYIVDFSVLFCLKEFFGIFYLTSAAVGFTFGIVTNYLLSLSWVFTGYERKSIPFELTIFFITGVSGLGLNHLIMWFFTDRIGLYYLVSKIISGALVLFWNFTLRKFILFNKKIIAE